MTLHDEKTVRKVATTRTVSQNKVFLTMKKTLISQTKINGKKSSFFNNISK